jgi:hypothetical protein
MAKSCHAEQIAIPWVARIARQIDAHHLLLSWLQTSAIERKLILGNDCTLSLAISCCSRANVGRDREQWFVDRYWLAFFQVHRTVWLGRGRLRKLSSRCGVRRRRNLLPDGGWRLNVRENGQQSNREQGAEAPLRMARMICRHAIFCVRGAMSPSTAGNCASIRLLLGSSFKAQSLQAIGSMRHSFRRRQTLPRPWFGACIKNYWNETFTVCTAARVRKLANGHGGQYASFTLPSLSIFQSGTSRCDTFDADSRSYLPEACHAY